MLKNELLSKERLKRQSVLKRIKRANSSQDNIKSLTAPGDGSCFFWSVALAYLIPVKDDEQSFRKRYRNLFGDDSDQQFNENYKKRFGHPPKVLEKEAKVRSFFQNYNPLYDDLENDSLKELVRRVFRNRVVDYVSSNQDRLLGRILESERKQYVENMRIDSISTQSWADEPEINAVMERFNINVDITNRYLDRSRVGRGNNNNVEPVSINLSYVNDNHYNYHLDQDIARGYYDKLLEDSSRVLKTSSKNDPVPFSGDSDEGNEVPLTKKDIINIADIEYDWGVGDSSAVIFDVVDTNELLRECTSQLLDKVKQNNKPLVYIVDLGSSHWVTLVIVYRDEQFFAYYIDPLGKKVDDNLKEHLKKENIHCPNIEVKQTDFNTGIFALKNLEVIFKGKRSTQKVILEQRPSFSIGINAELEKMKPPKNGQGLKDEIGKNNKYKRVGYDDLENQLDLLCSQLKRDKNGEATFIIFSDDTHGVILTVGFRDEQVVAYCVANDNTYKDNIKNLLSQKGIIPIFARDNISTLLSKFNNNIELFILQSAKVVTNCFKNHDYITLAKDELKKAVSGKEIEGVINRLKARNKIEDKIVRCKSVIDKYIEQYSNNLNLIGVFTEAQSNILILFLESTALEDMELSRSLGEKLKRIRTRIMGNEDFEVIDIIRSKNLMHRSDEMKNEATIIQPSDIQKFIRNGVSRVKFFRNLQTYLNQIIDKLNRKTIGSTREIKVDSFFKTEGEIKIIPYEVKTEEEIKEYLSESFRELVHTNPYSSKDTQMIMFKLVVNVIPLLEGLYSDKKKNKDKKLQIEELRNVQQERNELIHKFHIYKSEIARKFELKKYIDKIKPTFFKYVYSQRVYELLKGSTLQFSEDTIEPELKDSLRKLLEDFNYVADEFGDQNKAVDFQSIASMLEPSTSSEDSLRNFISNYVKLMHFIDNEDEIQKRKKKYPSLPQRYDQLIDNYDRLSDMRLYIYEHFNLLKQLYSKGSSYESEYKLIEVQLAKELKKKCGILKPSFESIVDLYVKGGNNINGDQFIKRIYDDIGTVSKIKGKDLKISDIIESYGKRESLQDKKGSTEEKFKSIPKGEIVNINGVDVSTDRFVVNILKLFDSVASQYKNVFNNVEEAFNDETFLSFLTHNNINFSNQVGYKLLRINCLSPYIVELIVRDQLNDQSGLISKGLVNSNTLNGIIETLLESKLYATHIKKLLSLDKEKLLKILSTQNQSLQNQQFSLEDFFQDFWSITEKGLVISKLYKLIYQKLNIKNIKNIYNLLTDKTHAIEILYELSKTIITNNGLDSEKINLAREILRLLDSISEELIYKKDYESLHKILNSAGVDNLVSEILKIDNLDLYALKIRRRIAVIKNEKDDEYDAVQRILEDIKSKIQLNAQKEIQSFFLLVSSDIAYTKHLKKEYKEAYKEYEALYKQMIELSLDHSIDDWSEFYLVGTYNKVMKSQKYVSILEYSPKYLDILKIRSDMAYELRSFALSKEKESQDEALKSYEDALKIYEEVYEIKATDSVLGQDIVKNIRDIAYVNNNLAKLKLSGLTDEVKLNGALSHYDKVLEMYSRVLRIQEKEQWETHPANSKTIQDIIQAMHNVAYVNNRLGSSKSSNNPEEALEHHKKALEIYQQVYEFQKGSLGEEHKYTLKTKKSVSYTHNQLAHLYDKVGNIDEAISHCRANLVLLEVNSEEYKKARSFLDKLTLDKQNPTLPSLQKCLKGRKKRNAEGECLFTWEDVDEFNEEKDERRDFSKIKIDSERFVSYIKDLPEEKQSQLIQLASGVKITGESQGLVSKLISNQKVMSHLNRVGRISGMTMHGMMAKNVLADFLNGDYQGVAVNVGFIAGGQGFAKVAEAASLKGLKLAQEGKLLVGRSLRAASPFLARGTSAFVIYDLVNQVKAFKNGTEEALAGIVGDSIYLGVDAAEIGIEIAEAFEVLEGVSSVTGPIGATIGAVVFVGTDIYMAVKRVDKIDQIIHLTGNEKFIEGLRAFIGMKPEQYIEELMEKKQLYNQLVKQGLEYLKQHSDIQSYVFPTGKSVVDSCRDVPYQKSICSGGFNWCSARRTVTRYTEKCTTKFEVDLDNTVLLERKRTDVKWSRAKPDNPDGGQVFCLSQGDYEPAPNYGSYLCESAIGVTDLSANKTGGYTLINLGEGKDNVKGFTDSRNIFVVNNGSKEYYGGNKDDIFVLQAGYVKGYLSGEGGINTLDTTSFAFQEEPLNIQLDIGEIVDYSRDNWLRVCDINKVIGRENRAETITVSCNGCNSNVKLIDGQSGNKEIKDKINIVDNHCSYQMQVIVRPNTVIYNRALEGNFDYLVPLNEGGSAEFIFGPERFNVNNTFWFGYEPVDIKSINVRYVNIFNRTEHEVKFNFIKSEKEFNVTIPYAENPSYRLGKNGEIKIGNKDNLYMLQSSNESSEEIIKNYLPLASRLNKMSFFIQSLLSNETVVIGSGNHEVIHNNPAYRSHLVGNGGENVYVIDSESKKFEVAIPEVIIYDLDIESSVDTIDLRNLVRQVRGKLSNQDHFQLKVLKSANDLLLKATVVEVKPTEDSSVSKMRKHEYCTVRLKDGVNWYNKTHVIVDNAPMKINLDNNEWSLKPQPLMFEKNKEVIIVTSQDIEENTELITPRRAGNYSFVSDHGSDLIVTNAFDVNVAKNDLCTIVLSKFYEELKMATLSIKFADKEIILKEHQKEISTARDVNVVKKEHKDQVYNGVFNHTKSSPEVIMLSDQPVMHRHRHSRHREQTRHRRSTSSGIRPTGWINDLFGWVRSSVSGLLSSKPESTPSPISQIDAKMDVNGTIMLFDLLIRKVTGQKYISTADQSISPLEVQGYALNITKGFEKVVEQAGLKSGVSMHRLNIDYMGMQKEITRKVMSGKFNEISGILKSYVEKACPGREAGCPGKLSPKKFDKFIAQFNKGLLNQSIEQILHNGDGTLEVDDAKQMSLEPQSYLSNASVHSHSEVSTCLSEIGVTKLGGNINR